jgi:hypothetical protein
MVKTGGNNMKNIFRLLFASLLILNLFILFSAANAEEPYNYVTQWGGKGTNIGQFDLPSGIVADSAGNVFVADSGNNRIQVFDNNGKFLSAWGKHGSGNGEFNAPAKITIDNSGNIFVADRDNNRIQKLDSSGQFLSTWTYTDPESGMGLWPGGVSVDQSGNVFVTSMLTYQTLKFSNGGNWLKTWGKYGSENGQFLGISGLKCDPSGNVFVSDPGNGRIQIFDNNGAFLSKWGSSGTGNGCFAGVWDVAFGTSGNVFVADTNNSRIQKFSPAVAVTPATPTTSTTLPSLNYILTLEVKNGASSSVSFSPPNPLPASVTDPYRFMPVRVLDKNGLMIINTALDGNGVITLSGINVGNTVQISYYKLHASLYLPNATWDTMPKYEFKIPPANILKPSVPVWGALVTMGPPPGFSKIKTTPLKTLTTIK